MGNGQANGLAEEERILGATSFAQLASLGLARGNVHYLHQPMSEVPGSLLISSLQADPNGKGSFCCPLIPIPPFACICPSFGRPATNFVNPSREFHPFPPSIAEIIPEQAYRDYMEKVNEAHRKLPPDAASCLGSQTDIACIFCNSGFSQQKARYDAVMRVTAATNEQWLPLGLQWIIEPYKAPRRQQDVSYVGPNYWGLIMNRTTRMALEMSNPQVPPILTRHLAQIQAKKDEKAMQEAAVQARIAQVNGITAPIPQTLADLERENAALRAQVAQLAAAQQHPSAAQGYSIVSPQNSGMMFGGGNSSISAPYYPPYFATMTAVPPPNYSTMQIEGAAQPHAQHSAYPMTLPGQTPSGQTMQ